MWNQRALQNLMFHLDNQCGIIQRLHVPLQGIYHPIKWRSVISPHLLMETRNRWLSNVRIIVLSLHHFTFVLSATHHFTIFSFHHVNMGILSAPFHHIRFTISLYQSISSSHYFTFFNCSAILYQRDVKIGIRAAIHWIIWLLWFRWRW